MARQQPIELFMPPNMLKAKAGSGFGGVDLGAIKRAENAMQAIKGEYPAMAADDVNRLASMRSAYATNPTPMTRAALLRAAHDLKGQAGTYDLPLIARIAGSLAQLTEEIPGDTALPARLVDAHVAAIQIVQRQNITGGTDKASLALIDELQAQVKDALQR